MDGCLPIFSGIYAKGNTLYQLIVYYPGHINPSQKEGVVERGGGGGAKPLYSVGYIKALAFLFSGPEFDPARG